MGTAAQGTLVIKNGWHLPGPDSESTELEQLDLVAENGRITAVGAGVAEDFTESPGVTVVDATDQLVVPGFVNAHYHSHDVLAKGTMEEEPLEWWALRALPPSFPPRSLEELRVRTLIGALECLRGGITTVQDMVTIAPFSDDALKVVVEAYEAAGIRAVIGPQYADKVGLGTRPFWAESIPEKYHGYVKSFVEPEADFDFLSFFENEYLAPRESESRVQWALAPTAPDSCSADLIERTVSLSSEYGLPIFTHLLESKSMAVAARHEHPDFGGSVVRWLDALGMVGPAVSFAHSVWLTPDELDLLAESGSRVVLNLTSNLKLKSGVPPIHEYQRRGISYGLGCDNPSCSDAQNMFQAMKLTATLNAVSVPDPLPGQARKVFEAATHGGSRAIGNGDRLGLLAPDYRADCYTIDLHDPAWLPLNDPFRQLVYSESGRGVRTVIVDGEVVIKDGQSTRLDESALRDELASVMPDFRRDFEVASQRVNEIRPYLSKAHRQVWSTDVGIDRFVGDGPRSR